MKKYTFRGKGLEELLTLTKQDDKIITKELNELFDSKVRRRVGRGLGNRYVKLVEKIRKSKKACNPGEKPAPVKTHYRNMIVIPEMVGAVVGVYSGKEFTNVEIKFDMIGKWLGEFAMTYKPSTHGRPGVGASKGS